MEGVQTRHAQELLAVLPVAAGVAQGLGLDLTWHGAGEPTRRQLGKLRTDSCDTAVEDESVCRVN